MMALKCNLQLPSVPGRLRGQWPRVQSRWHHVVFYQWPQWHTAPAGKLPKALCLRLGWVWRRWAVKVKGGIQNNTLSDFVRFCQIDRLFPSTTTSYLVAAGIAQEAWQQSGSATLLVHISFLENVVIVVNIKWSCAASWGGGVGLGDIRSYQCCFSVRRELWVLITEWCSIK